MDRVLLAVMVTVAGYLLLTGYDVLALRYASLSIPFRQVLPISLSAFAIGHNVGLASLSGGAIRYRSYSLLGASGAQIATVVIFISVTFFLGCALLFGLSALLLPGEELASIASPLLMRGVGVIALLFPAGYLIWNSDGKPELRAKGISLSPPGMPLALLQLLVSAIDIISVSGVLYLLVSSLHPVSYLLFLGVFLLALVVGAVSNVPGGLGVFESVLVFLLPAVPLPDLLSAMLLYRLLYFGLPLLIALMLLIVRELCINRSRINEWVKQGFDWPARIIPQAVGAAVFLLGALLIFKGVIPFDVQSEERFSGMFPLGALEFSHMANSIVGALLLVIARGLYRRLRSALQMALILLLTTVVLSLVLAESGGFVMLGPVTLSLLLWLARGQFYRGKSMLDQAFGLQWNLNISLVLVSALLLGFFIHRNVDYSNELWWQFTIDGDASRMLRAMLLSTLVLCLFGLTRLLRGNSWTGTGESDADLSQVARILQFTPDSYSNIALLGDKQFLFHPSGDAFLMYGISGHSAIALGEPGGNPDCLEEMLWQFREFTDAQNLRCVFYQITDRHFPAFVDMGYSFTKLGEEARVKLASFSLEGSNRSGLRYTRNHILREGASFRVVPAIEMEALFPRLKVISDAWLAAKHTAEKGFSLGFFSGNYLRHFDCAVIEVGGAVVAFANIWKSGGKEDISIDLMRYHPDAPKGVMDFLFIELLLWAKSQEYVWFSLGMAPLSGLEHRPLAGQWHKLGNLVYHFGEDFYNFDGLRNYKAKFQPVWEPRYLACKNGLSVAVALYDTSVLISGGLMELIRK